MESLRPMFNAVDKFVNILFAKKSPLLRYYYGISGPRSAMSLEDTLKIVLAYHSETYQFKNFKAFYKYVSQHQRKQFPSLLSYSRTNCLRVKVYRILEEMVSFHLGKPTANNIADSTRISTTKLHRSKRKRKTLNDADLGYTWSGYFFGFKLHIIINSSGEIVKIKLTPANKSDISQIKELCRGMTGNLYGDRGYVGKKLREEVLSEFGVRLKAKPRKNMSDDYLSKSDKVFLRKCRNIIETVIGMLKGSHDLEHSRHRSNNGFFSNLWGAILAYSFRSKKPGLSF